MKMKKSQQNTGYFTLEPNHFNTNTIDASLDLSKMATLHQHIVSGNTSRALQMAASCDVDKVVAIRCHDQRSFPLFVLQQGGDAESILALLSQCKQDLFQVITQQDEYGHSFLSKVVLLNRHVVADFLVNALGDRLFDCLMREIQGRPLLEHLVSQSVFTVCERYFQALTREQVVTLLNRFEDMAVFRMMEMMLKQQPPITVEEELAKKQEMLSTISETASSQQAQFLAFEQSAGDQLDQEQKQKLAESKAKMAKLNFLGKTGVLLHEFAKYIGRHCVLDPKTTADFDQDLIVALEQAFTSGDESAALNAITQLQPQKKVFAIKTVDGKGLLTAAKWFGCSAEFFVQVLNCLQSHAYNAITEIDCDQKNAIFDSFELNDATLTKTILSILGSYAKRELSKEIVGLTLFQHAANRVGTEVMTLLLGVVDATERAALILTDAEGCKRNMLSFACENPRDAEVLSQLLQDVAGEALPEQLQKTDISGLSAIHYACLSGDLERVKKLLGFFDEVAQQELLVSPAFKRGIIKVLPVADHPNISAYFRSLYQPMSFAVQSNTEVRIHQEITPVYIQGVSARLSEKDDVVVLLRGQDGKAMSVSLLSTGLSKRAFSRAIFRSVMYCLKDEYPRVWQQFEEAYHALLEKEQNGHGYIGDAEEEMLFARVREALFDQAELTLPKAYLFVTDASSKGYRDAYQCLQKYCGYRGVKKLDGRGYAKHAQLRVIKSKTGYVSVDRWDASDFSNQLHPAPVLDVPISESWSRIIHTAVNEPVGVQKLADATWLPSGNGSAEKMYRTYSLQSDLFARPLYPTRQGEYAHQALPVEVFDQLCQKIESRPLDEAHAIVARELAPLKLTESDLRTYAKALQRYIVANTSLKILLVMHLLLPEKTDEQDLSLMIHLLRSQYIVRQDLEQAQRERVHERVIDEHLLEEASDVAAEDASSLVDPILYQIRLLVRSLGRFVLDQENAYFNQFSSAYQFLLAHPQWISEPDVEAVEQLFQPDDLSSFRLDWPHMKTLFARGIQDPEGLIQQATDARLRGEALSEVSSQLDELLTDTESSKQGSEPEKPIPQPKLGARTRINPEREGAKILAESWQDRGILERKRSFREKLYEGTKTAAILLLKILAPLILIFAMPYVIQGLGIAVAWLSAHVMQLAHAIPTMV